MAAKVTVISGPARTGKTGQLLERYRQQLVSGSPGSAIWLSPTQRSARSIRGRLLNQSLPACFSPGIYTFSGFAELVLASAPQEIRPISSHIRRRLIARLIQRAAEKNELGYFAPIADTDGLIDLITGWIRELKRLEIWPEHFAAACKSRGASPKDKELVSIYQAYQESLTEHQLYDHEGCFWTAREMLQAEHWGPIEHLQLVVVDGFTDFTRTQHEILESLAGKASELFISLPLEANTKRTDLFSKTLGTLAELKQRFPQLTQQEIARPEQTNWPTLDHLERYLFCSPQDAVPLSKSDRVEILAASRRLGEIELVGRRIKQLLLQERIPPGDITVVFRSLTEAAPMVREVFRDLGIPFYVEAQQSLISAPAMKALVAMLQLHVDQWPFRSLLALLSNNYFHPNWPSWQHGHGAIKAEQLVRTLQVPTGREPLLKQGQGRLQHLQKLTEEQPPGEETSELSTWHKNTQSGLRVLEDLAAALHQLPSEATLVEWGQAWRRLAETTGLLEVVATAPPDGSGTGVNTADVARQDQQAVNHLFDVLSGGDRLSDWLGEASPKLSASEALNELLDLLHTEPLPSSQNETGCVRVLSAASARTLDIPYLFLAGLTEKSFPHPDQDGLYTEAETRRLKSAGLELVDRAQRNQEELLLFYEVLTRPSQRLYLSYPALDEKAQPLSPSSYLVEVERACGDKVIPREEEPDLSPIPREKHPLSFTDQRLIALDQLLKKDPAPLSRLLANPPRPDFAPHLKTSLLVTNDRQRGESFGPHEGVLTSKAARAALTAQFGPRYTWSASRLESYAYCPYRFFANHVLGVGDLADLSLEVDYGARGALLHDALSHIHRRLNELAQGSATPSEMDVEDFVQQLDEALATMIARFRASNQLEEAQREIDRRTLTGWGRQYHEQHTAYDEAYARHETPLRPAHFEVRFGPRRRHDTEEGEDTLSTDAPFEIDLGEETLLLTGRIDRIDRGVIAGQPIFNVLDYKSGRSARLSPADIEAGTALQLPLYTMAAHELLLKEFGDLPWQAGYWIVREKGFNQKHALVFHEQHVEGDLLQPSAAWQDLRIKVLQRVSAIVTGIRSAEFPMFSVDEDCTGRCEFSTVCRVNQTRSLEKIWPPPAEQASSEQPSE